MPKSILKNRVILAVSLLFLTSLFSILVIFYYSSSLIMEIPGVQKAKSLEEFLDQNPGKFMTGKEREATNFSIQDVEIPVQKKFEGLEVKLAPKLLGGGDMVYEPVALLGGNYFTALTKNNINNFFKVESEKEAILYVDFLRTKLGKSSYDRIKQTVWSEKDYQKFGCKNEAGESITIPENLPVSKATLKDETFSVSWIYFSRAFPAGYFKETFEIKKGGEAFIVEKSEKPFLSCGTGLLF